MATDIDDITPPDVEEAVPKKPGLLASKQARMMILVLVVMTAEAVGMWLFLGGRGSSDAAEPEDAADVETVEVEINYDFRPTNSEAVPGSDLQVSFKLYAVVAEKQAQKFEQLVRSRKAHAAVIAKIEYVIMKASLEELNDPAKRVLKQKIRENINKLLGKTYVHQIHLIGFNKIAL